MDLRGAPLPALSGALLRLMLVASFVPASGNRGNSVVGIRGMSWASAPEGRTLQVQLAFTADWTSRAARKRAQTCGLGSSKRPVSVACVWSERCVISLTTSLFDRETFIQLCVGLSVFLTKQDFPERQRSARPSPALGGNTDPLRPPRRIGGGLTLYSRLYERDANGTYEHRFSALET